MISGMNQPLGNIRAEFKPNGDGIRILKRLKIEDGKPSQKVINLPASLPAKLKLFIEMRFCYSVSEIEFKL